MRALLVAAYLYGNPGKDDLAESIEKYEGCSSWRMFTTGNLTIQCEILNRDAFRELPYHEQNEKGYEREAARLLATSTRRQELTIEPNAWLESYGLIDPAVQLRWNSRLVERLRTIEGRASRVRKRNGKRPMSVFRQRNEKFDLNRQKRKDGKRSSCLSERRKDRREFIKYFRELVHQAKEVVKRWRQGDFSLRYPPGLYAPNMPRLANILP